MDAIKKLAPIFVLALSAGCSGGAATPTGPTATPMFQLTGRVTDASAGIPVVGVTVSAADGANAGRTAITGTDGRYTLSEMVAGSFTLKTKRDGYEDFAQAVSVSNYATIDVRLIPGRSLNSAWSNGQFYANGDGQRIGARLTTISVSQGGSTLSGTFVGGDGSSGSFTGQIAGTTFTGTMRVELVFGTPQVRCRGTVANLAGYAGAGSIELRAPAASLENCGNTVTDVELTITP
jgi:Carboxypeptidase regulatory-like domain